MPRWATTRTTRRYFEMYNLMGDGAMDVYSDVPHALTVNYPAGHTARRLQPPRHGRAFRCRRLRNALVCAAGKNDTTIHSSAWTDSSGTVDLPVLTSAPDSISLTVTGHNLAPYLGAVLAVPAPPAVCRLPEEHR